MARIDDPFEASELLGFFRWDAELTEDLRVNDEWMYIAMHERRLRRAIRRGRLMPRGSFDVLVDDEIYQDSCSWLALQDWHRFKGENHFGPFVVRIKLRELNGRRFYVFERRVGEWRRFYFLQREENTALFETPAKRINPRNLFKRETNGELTTCAATQYEVIVTESISLARAKVEATAHGWCASNAEKCCGKFDKHEAIEQLEAVLGCEIPRRRYMFPQPFPLRNVIAPENLPRRLQPG